MDSANSLRFFHFFVDRRKSKSSIIYLRIDRVRLELQTEHFCDTTFVHCCLRSINHKSNSICIPVALRQSIVSTAEELCFAILSTRLTDSSNRTAFSRIFWFSNLFIWAHLNTTGRNHCLWLWSVTATGASTSVAPNSKASLSAGSVNSL